MFSCCQENNSPNYCVVHSMPSYFLLKYSNLVVFCCSSAYFLLDTFFSLPKNIPMLFPTQISEKFQLKKIFLLCPLLKSSSSVRLPLSPLCFQYILNISLFLHLIFQIFIKCFVLLDCTLFKKTCFIECKNWKQTDCWNGHDIGRNKVYYGYIICHTFGKFFQLML